MGNEAKLIRGQLRQIAKELLPEALASEVHTKHYNQLQREIQGKLQAIQAQVTDTLTKLDERSKEMQMFVMRQVMAGQTPAPQAEVAETTQQDT